MKAKSIKIQGCSISYLDEGSGYPSLVIHGWLGVKEVFQPIINELKHKHRMIVPDLPGLGDSQPLSDFKKAGIQEYLNFIDNFVNELNLDEFNIWGNSYGAIFALLYANKYPNKVKKIVLHAPVYSCKYLPKIFTNSFMFFFIKYSSRIKFLRGLYAKIVEKLFIDKMILSGIKNSDKQRIAFATQVADRLRRTIRKDSARVIVKNLIVEALKIDLSKIIKRINHPVLVVWGKDDKLNNYNGAEYLLENMINSELLETDNAHSITRQDFKHLSNGINKFLT